MSDKASVPQMHVRITPEILLALEEISKKITSTPSLSIQVTRRRGKLTHATVIRYALGRVLAELEG